MIARCEPGSVPSLLGYRRAQETHARTRRERQIQRDEDSQSIQIKGLQKSQKQKPGSSHKCSLIYTLTEAQSINMHSQHRSAADAAAVDPWVQNRLPGVANRDIRESTTGGKET